MFHLNKALLDLVTGVEQVLNGSETPQYNQRSCDFPESTKTLEMTTKSILNDSLQSPDPITHGHSTKRWGHIDRGLWGGKGSWECLKGHRYLDRGKEEPLKVGCRGCLQTLLLRRTLPLSPSSSRLPLIVNNIY